MMRTALLLCAALGLLFGLDRWVDRARRARREADPKLELLVSRARLPGEKVAAISVDAPDRPLFYWRKGGLWRCREACGAVCDEAAVRGLLGDFFEAYGVERTREPAEAASYGFAEGAHFAVSFSGPKVLEAPDRDVLVAFEVGRDLFQGRKGRAFVREKGSDRIFEIDRDPRRTLEARGDGSIPPLVDPRFLAGSFSGSFRGFREIRIDATGRESLRIFHDPDAPADAESSWILERNGRRESFQGWRAGGYMGLWLRGSFEGFELPSRAGSVGLDPPEATVALVPEDGEPIELAVSAAGASHRACVWNRRTNVIGVATAGLQPLLAPRAELFTDTARPNPWEAWLRKP